MEEQSKISDWINQQLADALFRMIKESSNSLKTYKLNSFKVLQKESIKNRWKINVNTKIEIDE